jgi:glucose/arabinose dehydrogenase
MTRVAIRTATPIAVLLATSALALAEEVRTGKAAYGDWQTDAPGVMRKITVNDLAAPLETPPTAHFSRVIAKPAGASLSTMPGFAVAPFATGMGGARVIRVAPNGDIFVARSNDGRVMVMRAKPGADKPDVVETFASGLRDPYGIAFYPPGPDPKWVYIAGTRDIVRFPYKNGDLKPSGPPEPVVSDLPTGGSHWTRDIAFSPDGKTMYVAVGSSGNVAENMGAKPELAAFQNSHALGSAWGPEEWRADVLAYDPDGKNKRVYATGIRNCSGLAVQPGTGTVYCATNERDLLGDNLPPDYVTSVQPGHFYGWPWYYIGDHQDTRPGGGPRPDLKGKVTVPDVLLQPHSAPLGLAFNDGNQFPAAMKGDAFVALHGSWNRKLHTGYKIVRVPFKDGKPTGEYQDFVTGFASGPENVWGRPVDVAFAKDGALLFSDDGNGVIYRVSYKGG